MSTAFVPLPVAEIPAKPDIPLPVAEVDPEPVLSAPLPLKPDTYEYSSEKLGDLQHLDSILTSLRSHCAAGRKWKAVCIKMPEGGMSLAFSVDLPPPAAE